MGCDADVVVGGHTHDPTDRVVDGRRLLNGGSTGLPHGSGEAGWLLIDATDGDFRAELRAAQFDVDAAAADLYRRRHPQAGFVERVLRGQHSFGR